ncbi:MAG: undecaprenyldiphospho-muramoylpentapeptide beta-N-acetylglucosaminyltransferase [Microscillaceae bacterium]
MTKIIISGGGTGGHIYPAIAIANEIKALRPEAEILFVGAQGRMEMEKVPKAGYPIEGLWISGLQRRLSLQNLLFPAKLWLSLRRAGQILRQFRPQAAVGVGGYASGPLLYAATRHKIPTLIQEQNSFAGLTNRWLASRVQKICVAYEGMEKFFPAQKLVLTGNPVRRDILHLEGKAAEGYAHFGLQPNKPTVLVIGGSQGAKSINEAIAQNLEKFEQAGAQLLWQTGKNPFQESALSQAGEALPYVRRTEFIYPMDLAYAVADVVISRAGALSVSELCIAAKPTVFVPLPTAAEDHQTQNARALVAKEAALLVPNAEAHARLVPTALYLLQNAPLRQKFSQHLRPLARPEATRQIAEEVLRLIK